MSGPTFLGHTPPSAPPIGGRACRAAPLLLLSPAPPAASPPLPGPVAAGPLCRLEARGRHSRPSGRRLPARFPERPGAHRGGRARGPGGLGPAPCVRERAVRTAHGAVTTEFDSPQKA